MDGVCRVGTSDSLVRGEMEGSGQSLCSRIASVRGTSGPSFYLLVINVFHVTVVSFGRHTVHPAMAPTFEAFREARCFTLGKRVPRFCPSHGKSSKSTL